MFGLNIQLCCSTWRLSRALGQPQLARITNRWTRTRRAVLLTAALFLAVALGLFTAFYETAQAERLKPGFYSSHVPFGSSQPPPSPWRGAPHLAQALIAIDAWAALRAIGLRGESALIHRVNLVVSPEGGLPLQGAVDSIANWVLGQGKLSLQGARIQWGGSHGTAPPLVLKDVAVAIENEGKLHRLSARGAVEGSSAAQVSIQAQFEGNPLTSSWNGTLTMRADALEPRMLASVAPGLPIPKLTGSFGFEMESTWRDGRLQSANTKFKATNLRAAEDPAATPRSLNAAATIQPHPNGWLAKIATLSLSSGPRTVVLENLNFKLTRGGHAAKQTAAAGHWQASIARIPMAAIRWLGALSAKGDTLADALRMLRLGGQVHDLKVSGPVTGVDIDTIELDAGLSDLHLDQNQWTPAFTLGAGHLRARGGHLQLSIESADLSLRMPTSFATPISLHANGSLRLTRESGAWTLISDGIDFVNPDLSASLFGHGQWPADEQPPELALKLAITRADVGRISAYLPKAELGTEVWDWLDHALVAGRVRAALIEYRSGGRPAKDIGFRMNAEVDQGQLAYAPNWPPLTDIQAKVRFNGEEVIVNSTHAQISGTRVRKTLVRVIDALGDAPKVLVDGVTVGDISHGTRFLQNSPLAPEFKHFLENVHAKGSAKLELKLVIPLGDESVSANSSDPNIDVEGLVQLKNNTLDLPALSKGLEQLNGSLRFGSAGVTSEGITAIYLNRPIELEVDPLAGDKGTRISVSGTATSEYLFRHFVNAGLMDSAPAGHSPLLGRMRGVSRWKGTVDVSRQRKAGEPAVLVSIDSDLSGVTVALPPPLQKDASENMRVQVNTRFEVDGGRQISLQLGNRASAVFEVGQGAGGLEVKRGIIQFGENGSLDLPATSSVHIGGHISRIDFGAWYALLESALRARGEASKAAPEAGQFTLAEIDNINLTLDQVDLFGLPLEKLRVDAARSADGAWMATLIGPNLLGEILVPADLARDGVTANFERLVIPLAEGADSSKPAVRPNPGELPPLRLTCRECAVGSHTLGVVKLSATPIPHGLKVDNLYVLSDSYQASAAGVWTEHDSVNRSAFKLEVHSDNLGNLIESFGYSGETTTGGATSILINADWPGSPADFALAKLGGVLHFRASRGTLLELNPGATGRVFGLLMLPALPRRLSLDFSDIFSRGFSYDSIEGSFNIDDGHAYTNNLVLDSASARINVAGRTGLVDETYDQVITVTPKLSSTLPFAPVWLAEKLNLLNENSIDKVFAYRYSVTGTWDNPSVESVPETKTLEDTDAKGAN